MSHQALPLHVFYTRLEFTYFLMCFSIRISGLHTRARVCVMYAYIYILCICDARDKPEEDNEQFRVIVTSMLHYINV